MKIGNFAQTWIPEGLQMMFIIGILGIFVVACTQHLHNPGAIKQNVTLEQPVSPECTAGLNTQEAEVELAEAVQHIQEGAYSLALPLLQKGIVIQKKCLGEAHHKLGKSLMWLGEVWYEHVEFEQAEKVLREAVDVLQRTPSHSGDDLIRAQVNLGRVLYAAGNHAEAGRILDEGLAMVRQQYGKDHSKNGFPLTHLGNFEIRKGNLQEAKRLFEDGLQFNKRGPGLEPDDWAELLESYGVVLGRLGEFPKAKTFLLRALSYREQQLGVHHPHYSRGLLFLALLQLRMNQIEDGIVLAQEAVQLLEESVGTPPSMLAAGLTTLGRLTLQRRNVGKDAFEINKNIKNVKGLFSRAYQLNQDQLGDSHLLLAANLSDLASVYRIQGKVAKAIELLEQALDIQEYALQSKHLSLGSTRSSLGWLYAQSRQFDKAKTFFQQAHDIRVMALGPRHPDVALSLTNLARLEHEQGHLQDALRYYQQAHQVHSDFLQSSLLLSDQEIQEIWKRTLAGFRDHLLLISQLLHKKPEENQAKSLMLKGFQITEEARDWLVRAAVARAAARQSSHKNIASHRLLSSIESLQREEQQLWTQVVHAYGQPNELQDRQQISLLKSKLSVIQKEMVAQNHLLQEQFPRVAELSMPIPSRENLPAPSLSEGEIIVSYFALADRLQIWIFGSKKEPVYQEVPIKSTDLEKLVENVRYSLSPVWNENTEEAELQVFDVESAAKLYGVLLEPIAHHIRGARHLIIAPDSHLLSLPFGLLLTDTKSPSFESLAQRHRQREEARGNEFAHYSDLPWLIKQISIRVIPSVSALKLLRNPTMPGTKDGQLFLGFGDPLLEGRGLEKGGAMPTHRGLGVDRGALLALNQLPGSRDELMAMASSLKVDPKDHLFLDENATETTVRALNDSGQLGNSKVLAFATHGLLSGELRGLTQPALVLTPPMQFSEEDDGLLSMEEVLALRLPHTELVVLSACNTAGDDGSGQGLSGLARAFFYAGAKSLLVSHWSVDDRATQYLMTEIFKDYAQDHVSVSEALQKGMLAVMEKAREPGFEYFAHPFAWAPFFVVGEGRKF